MIEATSLRSRYAEGPQLELHGRADLTSSSADHGLRGHALLAASGPRARTHASFSRERGEDREFGSGELRPTGYERTSFGFGGGILLGEHELELEARQIRTGESGTPALPLDIRLFDSKLLRLGYAGRIGEVALRARLFGNDVDHRMDGHLRPPPASPAAARMADATSRGRGWGVDASLPLGDGELRLGADGGVERNDMRVLNPNVAAFFVDSFEDVEISRGSVWAEWTARLGARLTGEVGVRYDRVRSDADRAALAAMLPQRARDLADAFNAADRSRTDNNVDWVVRLQLEVADDLTLLFGGARKTRSPSYIERYAWIPIEATAGLADGNNYVGDIGLEPEVSHELEIGLDWSGTSLRLSPRLFWRYIDDYIQGTPTDEMAVVMVSTVNGDDTPLRFTNIDARIWGADLTWRADLTPELRLEGVVGFARGRRRDVRDDLYRVAPLHGMAALVWDVEHWRLELESIFADDQGRVSDTLGERSSSGYGLLNARATWLPFEGMAVTLGVHNLLDRTYRDHLAGFARFDDRDVRRGERLPGEGRSLVVRVRRDF